MSEQTGMQDINIKLVEGDVSVVKTGFPSPVMLGLELNYDIVVTNNTNSPAESIDVVIEDQLNSNFSFVKAEVIGGAAVTPSYVNGLLTCDIGTISIGESKTLTVTVIPKVAGIIANQATAKVTAVSGNMDYLSNIANITIVDVVTQLGDVKTTVDSTATEVGSIKTTVDSTATEVGSIKTTVDSTATEVGSIKTTVDSTATEVGSIKTTVDSTATEVGSIKTTVDSTETKIDTLTTIDTETNGIVKLIQQEIGGIVNPDYYKLTTGIVIKDYNARSVVVAAENTTNSSVDIAISLIDHTKVPAQVFTRIITVDGKSRKSFIIGEPALEYEVIFDGICEGVYAWTATRTNGVFEPLNQSGFISCNTFRHSELVIVKTLII